MNTAAWLKIFQERQKELGLTNKRIAELVQHSEKTISRLFSGETKEPDIYLFYSVATVLNLSIDALFAGYASEMGKNIVATLQEEINDLKLEKEKTNAENALTRAELSAARDRITTLSAENDILRLKLEHKEEIIAIHNYYNKLK